MIVGLTDAAKVAGNRRGAAEMDIRAIGALGLQRLDVGRADDLHGRSERQHVPAVGLRLAHLAHANDAAGHQLPVGDGLLCLRHQPGEVLRGADFQRDGEVILKSHRVGPGAEHAPAILGLGDERAGIALGDQPFNVVQVLAIALGQTEQKIVELPRVR